jgi:single-strand DNA-binding protein
MSSNIQLVIYEGYLADDPEMRYMSNGKPVTNFRIGSNREYTTADGKKVKETTWLKCTAWGKLGEEVINKYCAKGSWVIVTGILRVGENGSPATYQTSKGDWAASYEITVDKIRILKGKQGAPDAEASAEDAGDVPF